MELLVSKTLPYHLEGKLLTYSGQDCRRIPPVLNKMFGNEVECLDLSFNSIFTLAGLSGFPKLKDFILDNNKISELKFLPYLPNLVNFSLNNNNISNLEDALDKIKTQVPNVKILSFLGNPACPDQLTDRKATDADYQRYRLFVIHKLPNVTFLDYMKVTDQERSEARRRGRFLHIRTPKDLKISESRESTSPNSDLPLLPTTRQEHKGAYGKCMYRYSGKHSEGNRFICNNDL